MTIDQICEVSKVAMLNDEFRQSGMGVTLTNGAQSLEDLNGLMKAVRGYDYFNDKNDPWHEHDFGKIIWRGNKVFWKIDYYDKTMTKWQEPVSPDCHRVLTVMLADEY